MANSKETNEWLDAVAKALLWCFVFGALLLLIWAAFYMLAPGTIYRQAEWFGLTHHEVDLIHYCGMGFWKACVLLFFLFPYISLRIVLRKRAV
jgi:hypothetical protein